MIQTHDNRVAALKTVLPLLNVHLDLIARVKSALGNCWESEPSPLDTLPRPKVITPDQSCEAQCRTCPDPLHCQDEAWVRVAQQWRHTYRLDDIVRALERLAATTMGSQWAAAVYWEYVEPWTSWNPANRARWAEYGLGFMAQTIPDRLVAFERPGEKVGKRSRDDEIVRLRDECRLSHHEIAKTVGCSKATVGAVLRGARVLHGRIVSATSP